MSLATIRGNGTHPLVRRHYYPALLLTPLRLGGALTLVFLSVLLALSLKAGLFAIPVVLVLMTGFFNYSFEFLDGLVAGRTEAPVLSLEMITGSLGEFRCLLPLIVVIALFFASGAGRYFIGLAAAAVAAACLLAYLPAVLAVQGWTGRLSHSLNPLTCLLMARSLGRDYLWIAGCTCAAVGVCAIIPGVVPHVPSVLRIALVLYAWLAMIAVIGGALRANLDDICDKLPLVVREARLSGADELEAARARWMDTIYGAWRGNARDNAWRFTLERIDSSADALQELQWLYARCLPWQQPLFCNRVAQEIVSRLLSADREAEALRLARDRLALAADFRPRTAEERRRLAQLARQWGDHATAQALATGPAPEPTIQT